MAVIAKTFEILDRGTFIPALAIKLSPFCEADRYLFARAGYGTLPETQSRYLILMKLVGGGDLENRCLPSGWTNLRMRTAHTYISDRFDELKSGEVIDIEFILGETKEPKESEQVQEMSGMKAP
jgi:hypothetical protein